MKLSKFGFLALPSLLFLLSSCLNSDDDDYGDYEEWRTQNIEYIEKAESETAGGGKRYEKVIPPWDQSSFVLMQWHSNRAETAGNLTPLDNSTVDLKYLLTNIEGDTIDSSYSQTQYGDSIFRCQPSNMVTGFWIAVTNMHVGDSVTAVMPYTVGYGAYGSSSVLPYSTLIFQIKLVGIPGYEMQP